MNLASVSGKNWVFKKFNDNLVPKYSEEFSINEIIARLLIIRNIKSEDVALFLNPTIKNLMPNPYLLNDMEKAVKKTTKIIMENEAIGIFGDYDVDGATATALLGNYFRQINHKAHIFIPDRKKDGYGPSVNTFKKLVDKKVKLIITVDCGTVSFDAINYANNQNVDVIVLDHHQSEIKLPNATAIVNPNRIDDKSNLNYLCAAGVTMMFLTALNKNLRLNDLFKNKKSLEPNLLNFLELVCLGTVCDVVPLVGLNRAFVKQGLKVIKNKRNIGIKSLYDIMNIQNTPNTYQVGYLIGPQINAGGRVGKSSHGSDLLMADDAVKAFKIASDLKKSNEERKLIERNLIEEVDVVAKKNINDPILLLSGNNWHEGIIGIIASRIKDKYNKPTLIISLDSTLCKGSARSVIGFDIGASIISAVHLSILKSGGGHKMAGGFTIDKNKIKEFKNFLISNFKKSLAYKNIKNDIYIDSSISTSALNLEFFNKINELSPFGSGNAEPRFLLEDIKVVHSYKIGDKHIKVTFVGKNRQSFKAIAFNAIGTNLEGYLSVNYKKNMNIIGKLSLNEWQGKRNIEFIIDDISVIKSIKEKVPSSIG